MTPALAALGVPGPIAIGGTPEGWDAFVLADAVRGGRAIIHVAREEARLTALIDTVSIIAPDIPVFALPAWDCLPYDRVSPAGEAMARRLDALCALATRDADDGGFLLVTTVAAVTQRTPPRATLAGVAIALAPGSETDFDGLTVRLAALGYGRADTVREPGEYAVRGGIIDLFPPGHEEPLRLDFFGDSVETIRSFDPVSQRSSATRDRLIIKPVEEAPLDEASITRFRQGYRERFGAGGGSDPLYEAVSAGRRCAGVEHWAPLFHERMETLFDFAPDAAVTLDDDASGLIRDRFAVIRDYFDARLAAMADSRAAGAPYNALPPEMLYIAPDEWETLLEDRCTASFSPHPPAPGARSIDAEGRPGIDFAPARQRPDENPYDAFAQAAADARLQGQRPILAATSAGARDRLVGVLREHGLETAFAAPDWATAAAANTGPAVVTFPAERGFRSPDLLVVTEQDLLGDRLVRRAKRRRKADAFIADISTLAAGDYVVHLDHGVGRYDGLTAIDVGGAPHDCLKLAYHGGDTLYVPVENLDVLSRYGTADAEAALDRLGGAAWQGRKAKAKNRLRDMAEALMKIAAARALRQGRPVFNPDGLYDEFAARFPYTETEDQLRAIETVFDDLASGRPMDRLICGDVGFGKTEVALRAAFAATIGAGMQVAVAAPTTLLARQHFRTFSERFQGLPVRVAQLSRFVSTKDANLARAAMKAGEVDIVVGTHALFAQGVAFNDLGLLIVDEEQHFGVKQKEKLKALRAEVHVLTLTATPIPRTLQMSLAGVRDMSVIATPPVDRLAVRTFVTPEDPVVLREAILRERARAGQMFIVCPRIQHLETVEEQLRRWAPDLKIAVAHGRMAARDLDAIMNRFYDGRYEALLSTNIVESGIDVPNANTMIIHRADLFGLSQLYQLRGRIGRSKRRAYCYLTLPPHRTATESAQRRLAVMQTLDSLGAGFQLASYDMDIRGAGNLLGEEQHGHIREVGVELYQRMLEEAVAAAQAEAQGAAAPEDAAWTPTINLGAPVMIPEGYVADLTVRMSLYRRLAGLETRDEIDAFAAELHDRFGAPPGEVDNLLQTVAIKQLCRAAGVEKLDAGPKGAVVAFRGDSFARPDKLVDFIARRAPAMKVRPDHRLIYQRAWTEPPKRIEGVHRLVKQLAKLATAA